MSAEHRRVPINSAIALESGFSIRVRNIDISRPTPGPVAQHEAAHVVAAGEIHSATIIPRGDALGTTTPKVMTAAAAGAAAARGHRGVGWDLFLAKHAFGADADSAIAQGRAALSGKEDEVEEVATILQERGTIDQSHVYQARENVRKRRDGVHPVEVYIKSTHGELRVYQAESHRDKVLIPGEWLELDKAA